MADQRISQLTKLAQGDVAANDVLAIVDVGASTTKKVEAKDLFQAGANLADSASIDLIKLNQASATKLGTTALADDAVTAAKLGDDSSIAYDSVAPSTNNFEGRGYVNSTSKNLQVWDGSAFQQVVAPTAGIENLAVTTGKLAANAVTTAKVDAAGLAAAALATDSVITAKIQDLAVTTGKLAALSVTTAKIAADAVTADELASNAVVTASIVDANVTEAKLATGAVTEAKIGTAAVTVTKVADASLTYAKLNLADASVPGAKLVSNSVTSTQLAVDAVTTGAITALNVTTAKLADGAVTAAKLGALSVTTAKIAADAVTAAELANNSVDTAAIVDAAVTEAKLASSAVTEAKIAAGAVTVGKIADTQITYAKLNLADGSVPGAKLTSASVTTTQIATDAINTSQIVNDAVTTAKIADDAITADQLATNSVTADAIAANAVGASELADDAVDTAAIVNVAVTEAKIATGAVTEAKLGTAAVTVTKVADTSITYAKLNLTDGSVPGGKLTDATVTSTKLASNAVTTGSITDLNVTTGKLADSAVTNAKLANGAITTAKIDAAGLGEAAIATSAVTTGKVLDGAITAAKLATDSTTIVQAGTPVGSGVYEGQLWFDTNTSIKYVWNGSAWIRQAALNVINFSDTTPLNFAVVYPDNHTANITTTLDTQDANAVFIGPASGADAAPTFRALTPADLPDATASTKGIVQPGTGLAVNAGVLNHSNTVTPGTYTRLVVDAQGHISQGQLLEASDIPSLDAAKITTGGLPTDRLADAAVTIDKMADYSTASIGTEFPAATFTGQLHLNSLDRSFYMWDGNVWVPIGISAGQIVLAGTFDASSPAGVGKVQSVTPEGAAAGFVVNNALPVPTQGNNKHYFVVSEGGTITSGNAPAGVLAPPDLLLSVYNATLPQWVEIDVSAGAGAIAAANVSFVPAGDIAASNVQTAIEEVSTECRNATNITSGTLAVARGGTNVASYTKGDLLAASASTTLTKLPVGTNGQVLRANSATATGLEYGADFVGTVTTVTSSTAALTVATATTTPALTVRAATTSVDGIVQLSDSTSTTSSVLAATPTAVKSAYDLAALALPAAGGTVTGDITLGANIGIQFEGTTDDANEIRLIAADATVDRTITLPNVTGTVVTTGDSGTVTSTMIADGTIANADVNASAAIAGTKISPDFGSQTVVTTGVFSHALGAVGTPSITFTGDLNTGIYSPGADQVALSTGGTERARIDSSGNVGIGTTSPAYSLDVRPTGLGLARIGSQDNQAGLYISSGNGSSPFINFLTSTSTLRATIYAGASSDDLIFGTGASGTERARIDSSGRLLVGTSSTNNLAGLAANIQSEGNANAGGLIAWSNVNTSQGSYLALGKSRGTVSGSNTIIQNGDQLGIIYFFGADGTNRNNWGATISAEVDGTPGTNDMPGRLVFSTTADGASASTERMRISSDGALKAFSANTVVRAFSATGAGTTEYLFGGWHSSTDIVGTGSTISFVVFTNGNVQNTNNSYGAISDAKLKENIVDATSQWNDLKALQVRKYNFKEGQTHTQIGLVAQEVELVSPGLVTESPDRDAEGNDLGTVTKSVNYSVLYMKAVKALQEAMERIETLEARLTAAGIE